MTKALILVLVFTATTFTDALAQENPPPCELTQAEEASRDVLLERLVQPGDPLAIDLGTTAAVGGCGVWEVSVAADGSVTSAKMLRGEPTGAYERFVGPWLRLARYRPNDQPWTSVVLIRFTE